MTDYIASFIASPDFVPGSTHNPAAYFRRPLEVRGVRRATLLVTAMGLVEPWLNGVRVGDELLAPGWTSYDHRLAVSSWDVTDLLVDGTNVLGAVLGEGWAVGRVGWEGRRAVWAERPSVFVQLDIEDADGVWSVCSDRSWRTTHGGVGENSLFEGEAYDARLEITAWCTSSVDDADWQPVEVVERDLSALLPRTWEPIRAVQELPAKRVFTTPAGRTVVDVGQNIAGWLRVRVKGPAGTRITLHFSETLIHDEIDFETNRGAAATDVYVLSGAPAGETWEPRFTFHGFRYVDVDGWPGELTTADVTAVVVHSDMTRTGWLETSHPGLNQLHSNVVWSMRGNFVGVPTDCPQRDERAGWTGDINAFATTAAYLYDVRGVLGSWLDDLAADQQQWGSVPFTVPNVQAHPAPPTALWGDVAVNLPWVLYEEHGDASVLERQYPSMTAFVDQVEGRLDEDGLWSSGFQLGDWLDPDAPASNAAAGRTDRFFVASAFFCRTTDQMARIAAVLGKDEDAARYARLHDRVRAAFRREWVTSTGRLANESQTAYALAICFDLLDEGQTARAGERLAELVAKAGFTVATGFAGTPLVADALTKGGQLGTAYRLLLQEQCPSFLYPLSKGATTTWERWDAIMPDGSLNSTGMTSLNHYALGAVAAWLHRVVGGLAPAAPGYAALRVAPRPGGGLTHAKATKDTPHGRASVSWADRDGVRTVEVLVPQGVNAEVVLPDHPDRLVERVAGGEHSWSYPPVPVRDDFPTMRTPLKVLCTMPVWQDVITVFCTHIPGLAAVLDRFDLSAAADDLQHLAEGQFAVSAAVHADLVALLQRESEKGQAVSAS
jgi:alpha-L-rhamnosidase